MQRDRHLEPAGFGTKERREFRLDLLGRGEASDPQIAAHLFAQALQFSRQRLAVGEFQQVQAGSVTDRDHRAKRCVDPVGLQ